MFLKKSKDSKSNIENFILLEDFLKKITTSINRTRDVGYIENISSFLNFFKKRDADGNYEPKCISFEIKNDDEVKTIPIVSLVDHDNVALKSVKLTLNPKIKILDKEIYINCDQSTNVNSALDEKLELVFEGCDEGSSKTKTWVSHKYI